MRTRAAGAIDAILARARQKVEPTNQGTDIDATIGATRSRLRDVDTQGARAILANQIAEEQETRRLRLVPLLEGQLTVEKLSFDYEAAKTLRQLIDLYRPAQILTSFR